MGDGGPAWRRAAGARLEKQKGWGMRAWDAPRSLRSLSPSMWRRHRWVDVSCESWTPRWECLVDVGPCAVFIVLMGWYRWTAVEGPRALRDRPPWRCYGPMLTHSRSDGDFPVYTRGESALSFHQMIASEICYLISVFLRIRYFLSDYLIKCLQ